MKTQEISREQMIDILNAIKGCRAITIEFASAPKMLVKSKIDKTPNPFKNDITKVRRYNGMVNFEYENSVNNQREREGGEKNFKVGQASYGNHVGDNRIVVEHDDGIRKYIQFKLERVIEQHYEKISDGSLVDNQALADFFSDRPVNKGQGVDKSIKIQRILWTNITAFVHNKTRYEIIA